MYNFELHLIRCMHFSIIDPLHIFINLPVFSENFHIFVKLHIALG